MLKRMAQFAEKHKVYIAYHTHAQGSMTAFDEALAMSKWNMSNVDLGHYVAAGNNGGSPLQFLEAHHGRIASFHLKDRTLPEHCSLTVPFGKGDGQIKDILLLMKKNKWTFPASIELESPIPAGLGRGQGSEEGRRLLQAPSWPEQPQLVMRITKPADGEPMPGLEPGVVAPQDGDDADKVRAVPPDARRKAHDSRHFDRRRARRGSSVSSPRPHRRQPPSRCRWNVALEAAQAALASCQGAGRRRWWKSWTRRSIRK